MCMWVLLVFISFTGDRQESTECVVKVWIILLVKKLQGTQDLMQGLVKASSMMVLKTKTHKDQA